jgi:hypothetical protein
VSGCGKFHIQAGVNNLVFTDDKKNAAYAPFVSGNDECGQAVEAVTLHVSALYGEHLLVAAKGNTINGKKYIKVSPCDGTLFVTQYGTNWVVPVDN